MRRAGSGLLAHSGVEVLYGSGLGGVLSATWMDDLGETRNGVRVRLEPRWTLPTGAGRMTRGQRAGTRPHADARAEGEDRLGVDAGGVAVAAVVRYHSVTLVTFDR